MINKEKIKKKLLNVTTILTAVLVITIIINIMVWKNRPDKSAVIESLTGEISRVTQQVQEASQPAADTESRLAEAEARLATAQTAFPPEFNRNDILEYIIGLSRECQVEVLPISSQGWLNEKTGPVLKLTGTVSGTFTRANEFIDKLQNGKYETLIIPEIAFTRQSGKVGTEYFSGDETMVTVRINVSVFAGPAALVKGENR